MKQPQNIESQSASRLAEGRPNEYRLRKCRLHSSPHSQTAGIDSKYFSKIIFIWAQNRAGYKFRSFNQTVFTFLPPSLSLVRLG